ncbi:MAG: hypothetical protein FJ264_09985 [Planctomycetes bacterium]|nr:hypothetical protein [Planctomycetota bacterium]
MVSITLLIPEIYRKTTLKVNILCIFFCLFCTCPAISFAFDHIKTPGGENNVVDYTPVQGYLRPLKLRRDTLFEYTCNECHRVFDSDGNKKHTIFEHTDVKLHHGKTTICLSCHHKTNRNVYVTNDGQEIPSDKPEELCSQCHGTTYRDWKVGTHGRANGYWNSKEKGWYLLTCIECHNPHNPAFPKLVPMSGPVNTGRHVKKGTH